MAWKVKRKVWLVGLVGLAPGGMDPRLTRARASSSSNGRKVGVTTSGISSSVITSVRFKDNLVNMHTDVTKDQAGHTIITPKFDPDELASIDQARKRLDDALANIFKPDPPTKPVPAPQK